MNPADPSKRRLFRAAGATGLAAALPLGAEAEASSRRAFLSAREAAFVEAAVARLIPADDLGPGALEAGVPAYIDRQLGGAWGEGERLYRGGPWREGEPTQGYQLPFTPAQLFRAAIHEIDVERFTALEAKGQDELLRALEKEKPEFFDALLSLTVEGFFCDPVYGGNRGMAGWRLVGFPGAYANYYELVDRHNVRFAEPPVSLGQDARGRIHLHPVKK